MRMPRSGDDTDKAIAKLKERFNFVHPDAGLEHKLFLVPLIYLPQSPLLSSEGGIFYRTSCFG